MVTKDNVPLLDVWTLDVGPPGDLDTLADVVADAVQGVTHSWGPAGLLFRLRLWLGEVFGWDRSEAPSVAFSPVAGAPQLRRWSVSNKTVDARLDLTWGRLTVYAKPRGALGSVYLALITPFRHLIVYPTLLRAIARAWKEHQACNPQPSSSPPSPL